MIKFKVGDRVQLKDNAILEGFTLEEGNRIFTQYGEIIHIKDDIHLVAYDFLENNSNVECYAHELALVVVMNNSKKSYNI